MFKPMLEKPKNNPYYITTQSGGYNTCGKGNPVDKDADALANCISFAVGRFNEVAEAGWCHWFGSMNASSFYTVAQRDYNFPVSQVPQVGAIACWNGGKNGQGHVASCEIVYADDDFLSAESGKNSYVFKNIRRKKGNGNWGMSKDYKFLGFVINPYIKLDDTKEKIKKLLDGASENIKEAQSLLDTLD